MSSRIPQRSSGISERNGPKLKIRKDEKQKAEVEATFERLYPRTPVTARDAIYSRAFEKGSGRVGTAKNLGLDFKVREATRYHVLHEMTDFNDKYESQCGKLYDKLQNDLKWSSDRDADYEDFRAEKSIAYESLSARYLEKSDGIIKSLWAPLS